MSFVLIVLKGQCELISFLLVEEFYGTRCQSGSFSLNVGSVFSLPA